MRFKITHTGGGETYHVWQWSWWPLGWDLIGVELSEEKALARAKEAAKWPMYVEYPPDCGW